MAQNNIVSTQTEAARYTRSDFTALRYRLNGLALEGIMTRLYSDDDLDARGIDSPASLGAWLTALRDVLIERALKTNPMVSTALASARASNRWAPSVIDFLVAAGEQDYSKPKPNDTLTEWFKPVITSALKAEGINSIGGLKKYIEVRGDGWFRGVQRVGEGKAHALEAWLRKHEATVGQLAKRPPPKLASTQLELTPSSALLPLSRVSSIAANLDGRAGSNRNHQHCLLSAKNDLQAIQAYLMRFSDRPFTQRSYQKELERFLLWCVKVRGVALSSALVEECEAYKAFLANPDSAWRATKTSKQSTAWRPFGPEGLQPQSQRYAIQVIRTFFAWLIEVRYLSGNPWALVRDPVVPAKERAMDIDKALPFDLWLRLVEIGGLLDQAVALEAPSETQGAPLAARQHGVAHVQYRLARAAILLIGYSGIRREEAATATMNNLKPVPNLPQGNSQLWELAVLGKRSKWRTVMLPERVIGALQAHWADRGHTLQLDSSMALLSPVTVSTKAAVQKHVSSDGLSLTGVGFAPDSLYDLVKTTVRRLVCDERLKLSSEDRATLLRVAPHALRHTFATQAAKTLPTDVLQRLLGHASLSTTSIYVRAETSRVRSAYADFIQSQTR